MVGHAAANTMEQAMKRSIDRILTTHVGSLARPKDLLDVMKTKLNDEPYDREAYAGSERGGRGCPPAGRERDRHRDRRRTRQARILRLRARAPRRLRAEEPAARRSEAVGSGSRGLPRILRAVFQPGHAGGCD